MRLLLILLITLSFNTLAFSDNETSVYSFTHPTCKTSIMKDYGKDKDDSAFESTLISKLKERGYKPQFLGPEKIIIPGNLHLTAKKTRVKGKLWKDCLVKIEIRMAKTNRALSSDKVLFTKETKRSLPRHTFKGNERCTRAIKDAFVHIPYCDTP